MNFFRSEEHARAWIGFDPEAEEGIMPVRDWAFVMGVPAARTRLEPDTLTRQQAYGRELLENLAALGRDGPRWRPQEGEGG